VSDHEPSLEPSVAPTLERFSSDLKGLRDLLLAKLDALREMMDERDRRYAAMSAESKEAVRAAFVAQKELTDAAFKSSEKAIIKAEDAQREYNARSNEFRGQLEDQASRLMPKDEANARFKVADDKIDDIKKDVQNLRESRSEIGGKTDQNKWLIGIAVGLAGAVVALVFKLMDQG
jgi:hypothetical protein